MVEPAGVDAAAEVVGEVALGVDGAVGLGRDGTELLDVRDGGQPLPALAFFHIPLPEYNEIWDRQLCEGHKHETICCPNFNSGFFAALRQGGDVLGTFVGHDHVNDFEGELDGIRLCYGRASGFNTYGFPGFERGARVIQLYEGQREFKTWFCLEKDEGVRG